MCVWGGGGGSPRARWRHPFERNTPSTSGAQRCLWGVGGGPRRRQRRPRGLRPRPPQRRGCRRRPARAAAALEPEPLPSSLFRALSISFARSLSLSRSLYLFRALSISFALSLSLSRSLYLFRARSLPNACSLSLPLSSFPSPHPPPSLPSPPSTGKETGARRVRLVRGEGRGVSD